MNRLVHFRGRSIKNTCGEVSDDSLVLEQGLTRIEDRADTILADPRIAQLFLGGGIAA